MPLINRRLWIFYKTICILNIAFSLITTIGIIDYFPFVFFSVGFAFASFFTLLFKQKEILMFHNLGYSRQGLLIAMFLINVIISVFIFLIFQLFF